LIKSGDGVLDDGETVERFEHRMMLITPPVHIKTCAVWLSERKGLAEKGN